MSKTKYPREKCIEEIKGTDGIVSVYADKMGVSRQTVYNWMDKWKTFRDAWNKEKEVTGDIAESVVAQNIRYAREKQKGEKKPVDSGDAKWYLSRVRRGKFALRQEYTGADGERIDIHVTLND